MSTAAFLWLYTDEYEFYKSGEPCDGVLINMRHNGKFGTFGGKIEEDETIIEGLLREVKEESGIDISPHSDNIKGLTALKHNGMEIHSYYLKVDIDTLRNIRLSCATKLSGEVSGSNIIASKQLSKRLDSLPFAGTGLSEVNLLLDIIH